MPIVTKYICDNCGKEMKFPLRAHVESTLGGCRVFCPDCYSKSNPIKLPDDIIKIINEEF